MNPRAAGCVFLFTALCCLLSFVHGQFGRRNKEASCPRPTLENGRVRVRAAGRTVKFACSKGYYLYGESFATCIDGQWSSLPVCARSGCPKPEAPLNGRLVNVLFGTVVFVECDPGYLLNGPRTLFCNGATWNDSVPTCSVGGNKPQMSCDFESETLCGWKQDQRHDFDWRRFNGPAPSVNIGTGPSFDKTLGEAGNGYYMYIEASAPRLENDTARLFSPVYGPDDAQNRCFSFWYHMHGPTIGRLHVYVKPESKKFNEIGQPTFAVSGNQGDRWIQGMFPLPDDINENFQIVIEGVRGHSYLSDIAIDDVMLGQGDQCKTPSQDTSDTGSDATIATSLPANESCSSRCGSTGTDQICDCRSSCLVEATCCADYTQFCFDDVNVNSDQPSAELQGNSQAALGFGDTLIMGLAIGGVVVGLAITLTITAVFRRQGQRSRSSKEQHRLPEDSDVRYLREDDDVQLDLTEATPKFTNFDSI